MIKVYLHTKTKLGYLYFPYNEGNIECHNIIKEFPDQFALKNHLESLKIDCIKFQMDAFVSCYKKFNVPATDLDAKSIDTLFRLNQWMNDGDKPIEKIKIQISKRREEFVSLIKSSKEKRNDLTMIYKLIFESITDE